MGKAKEAIEIIKALSLSEMSDINVDMSDHAIVEMASKDHPMYEIIRQAMADFQLGEVSRKISLGLDYELSCRQEDNGIYSGEVRCTIPDSGEYGQVVHKIIKKTLADLVQELKLKEFIPVENQETELPELEPVQTEMDMSTEGRHLAAEVIEDIVEEHEVESEILGEDSEAEAQADLEMYDKIKDVIQEAEMINEARHANEELDNILSTIMTIADIDTRPININIHLSKAKRAEVGEVHIYNGKKYQKQADGSWKPYETSRSKAIQNKQKAGKSPREIDRGKPHDVDMVLEIEGQEIHKRYENIHGENKKWVEMDLLDKLERTLGKKGIEFKVKEMKVAVRKDEKEEKQD